MWKNCEDKKVVFYGPSILSGYFGRGYLTYRHCSWASLLGRYLVCILSPVPDNCPSWLVVLRLNVPVNNFQSCRDGAIASWVINQYFRGVKCLAQGHNTAAVGLEPRTSRSGVRHSTTEPPRSPTALLESAEENGRRNYFMTNLHEKILPDVRIKTLTVRIPGGCTFYWASVLS